MRTVIMSLACAMLFAGVISWAEEPSEQLTPPSIDKTAPKNDKENMSVDDQNNACQNIMYWIELAINNWAIEMGKTNGSTVVIDELVNGKYLPDKFLKCPSGGQYKYTAVGKAPECSIHGTFHPKYSGGNIYSTFECKNHMYWIGVAKDQWAIEMGKTNGSTVVIDELVNGKYLPDKLRNCPSGGQYKYNAIGELCWCPIHGTAKSSNENMYNTASWDYWGKFNEWEALLEGKNGMPKDETKAGLILTQLIKGVYLVKFDPANGFNPQTPDEFLQAFYKTSSLMSAKNKLGGACFFRTKRENNKLTASFLTDQPDQMKQDIERNPQVVFISSEEITPEKFIAHVKSVQESLRNEPMQGIISKSIVIFDYMVQAKEEVIYEIHFDGKFIASEKAQKPPWEKLSDKTEPKLYHLYAAPGNHVLTVTAPG